MTEPHPIERTPEWQAMEAELDKGPQQAQEHSQQAARQVKPKTITIGDQVRIMVLMAQLHAEQGFEAFQLDVAWAIARHWAKIGLRGKPPLAGSRQPPKAGAGVKVIMDSDIF